MLRAILLPTLVATLSTRPATHRWPFPVEVLAAPLAQLGPYGHGRARSQGDENREQRRDGRRN